MNFITDLEIKYKLFLGFAITIIFTMLIGYFGFKGMQTLNGRIVDIQLNIIPSITKTAEMDHYIQRHRQAFLHYQIAKNISTKRDLASEIKTYEVRATSALAEFQKYNLLPEEQQLCSQISEMMNHYFADVEQAKAAIDKGVGSELLETDNSVLLEHFSSLELLRNKLSRFNVGEAQEHYDQSASSFGELRFWLFFLIVLLIVVASAIAIMITFSIVRPVRSVLNAIHELKKSGEIKVQVVEAISSGDLDRTIELIEPLEIDQDMLNHDEAGALLKEMIAMSHVQYMLDQAFNEMTVSLRHNRDADIIREWFKNGQNELNAILRGEKSIAVLTGDVLAFLAEYVGAGAGTFYVYDEQSGILVRTAGYALTNENQVHERIVLGEGLAGQAAKEKKAICLDNAPPEYLKISSGLGAADPVTVLALPLVHNNVVSGLIELASLQRFTDNETGFLEQVCEWLAIALSVAVSRERVGELLEQTQSQAGELRVQQEELQQTNEELEERAQMLELQKDQIRAKNNDIEQASRELEHRAEELERVSTYKSQFLANMSHELRTPLNSMMILSSLLKDNRDANLTDKQVEFASTINSAGRDLLALINDILDLSKIEAGRLDFHYEELSLEELCLQIQAIFVPIALEKNNDFTVTMDRPLPDTITSDGQRIQQILKNLLSNAHKFTEHGVVSLRIYTPGAAESLFDIDMIAFCISDTGIGIPADKLDIVFNAFQQADGSTSRKYGGTGLGLSISRQLARTMGGEIAVTSEPGSGSRFTLYLPVSGVCQADHHALRHDKRHNVVEAVSESNRAPHSMNTYETGPAPVPDDRERLQSGEKSILVIEDDLIFAKILVKMVQIRGFAALAAADGESGIGLAEHYQPNAIILDVMLPHLDGWGVMRSLKDNPKTRHIPVHFITCLEERQKAMNMGAVGLVTKPVSGEQLESVFSTLEHAIDSNMKMLLIVEDDKAQSDAMIALLENRNVTITAAETGRRAIELLADEPFDCIVLDLGLADMGAFELLEALKKLEHGRRIPVIIHTGRDLTHLEEKKLRHYAESIIIKGAKSPERLLNEVTLFLHLVETSLDPDKQRMIRTSLDKEAMLEGKRILIVDDDMRNIFSLSSALSEKGMVLLEAENGAEALKVLDQNPDIDLVLMDIMMPVMDGYEAMRCIRKDERFTSLPILALTAKAMKGDREECLAAGASDYIPKPVDIGKLFSLLRVWLYKSE